MHPAHQPIDSQQIHRRLEALADELARTKRRIDQVHAELAQYWDDLLVVCHQRAAIDATLQRLKRERQYRKQRVAQNLRRSTLRGGS